MAIAMTVVLLIRHASNDFLKEHRLAGWTPGVHLNAQGRLEAEALARRLNHLSIHAIYSSPLERAVDTARVVAQYQKLDVNIMPELGEVHLGAWEGKLIKEVEHTDLWKQLQSQPVGVSIAGGESIDQVQQRMVAAIERIVAQHPKQIVAVVSHADPIKAVVAHYLEMDLNAFQRLTINPASVTVLLFNERKVQLFRLNDGEWLPTFEPEKKAASERKE